MASAAGSGEIFALQRGWQPCWVDVPVLPLAQTP